MKRSLLTLLFLVLSGCSDTYVGHQDNALISNSGTEADENASKEKEPVEDNETTPPAPTPLEP